MAYSSFSCRIISCYCTVVPLNIFYNFYYTKYAIIWENFYLIWAWSLNFVYFIIIHVEGYFIILTVQGKASGMYHPRIVMIAQLIVICQLLMQLKKELQSWMQCWLLKESLLKATHLHQWYTLLLLLSKHRFSFVTAYYIAAYHSLVLSLPGTWSTVMNIYKPVPGILCVEKQWKLKKCRQLHKKVAHFINFSHCFFACFSSTNWIRGAS